MANNHEEILKGVHAHSKTIEAMGTETTTLAPVGKNITRSVVLKRYSTVLRAIRVLYKEVEWAFPITDVSLMW